jgi:hypothetical protein
MPIDKLMVNALLVTLLHFLAIQEAVAAQIPHKNQIQWQFYFLNFH